MTTLHRIEEIAEVSILLGMLTESQREAVEIRFGLDGLGERTEAEVGKHLGISRDSAHDRIEGALRRMRGAYPQNTSGNRIHG